MRQLTDDNLGTESLGAAATASCRLDWVSVSLFGASERRQREQLAYFFSLLRSISDGATWPAPSPSKFFDNSVSHEAGLSIKWTQPGSGNVNQGLMSVDIRGAAFKALDREERKDLYLDISEMEGFKQCTRLDAQRTVLNPIASAEEIFSCLSSRTLWVKSFRGFRQMGELDGDGVPSSGSTVMWGSPESAVRARSYNKAVESGWDIPAVRHEVQLRRQPARDKWNFLIEQLRVEQDDHATKAENAFVQSVLNQHMAYLDTTRLAKRMRKEWPADWAQRCGVADWWDKEVVTGDPKEIKTQWKLAKKLEDSVKAGDVQYGRIYAKWMLVKVHRDGLTPDEALLDMSAQWVLRLKDEDLEDLLLLTPEEKHDTMRENFHKWRQIAAHNAEQITS